MNWIVGYLIRTIIFTRDIGRREKCLPWGGGGGLRHPDPYLRKVKRKTQKTPNSYVDERDRGSNPALPVYQLLEQNICQWWGYNEL